MAKKVSGVLFGLTLVLIAAGCVSVDRGPLSPNASQSVITVRRASSGTAKKEPMILYIDGRQEGKEITNGASEQALIMNGLHNVQVKVGKKHESQMLTFDCKSEVVEFYANFEEGGGGSLKRGKTQLNLVKISGGTGGNMAGGNNAPAPAAAPVFNITVDNSSSAGNTSTNTNTTTTTTIGD
jgi:hypothetical protein